MEEQNKTKKQRFKALIAGAILLTNIGTYCAVNQYYKQHDKKEHEKDHVALVITQSKEGANPTIGLEGSIGEKTFSLPYLENMVAVNTDALAKAAYDAGKKLSTKLNANLTKSYAEKGKNDYRIRAIVYSTILDNVFGWSKRAEISITPTK